MAVKDLTLETSAVEALSRMGAEPEWLRQDRLAAARAFAEMDYPRFKDEEWRRTELSHLDLSALVLGRTADAVTDREGLPGHLPELTRDAKNVRVMSNATLVYTLVDDRPGLTVTSLDEAARSMGDKVKQHLHSVVPVTESKFTALAAAAFAPGTFVHVAKDTEVDEPLYLFTYAAGHKTAVAHQTLVVAEAFSKISIIEYLTSPGDDDVFHTGTVEVIAMPGAQVTYTMIQAFGDKTVSFISRRALVKSDARVDWHVADLGGTLVRADQESRLVEPGAASYSLQLLAHDGEQKHDLGISMEHYADHTDGDIKGRAVGREKCRTVLRPVGHIRAKSSGSSTFQRNNVLLLDADARCDAIPTLLIDNNDVAAGHAATVGQVDWMQLFYLMSRGITKPQALKMLVEGFLSPIKDEMQLGVLKDELDSLLHARLGLERRDG